MVACPLHDDRTPSCSINLEKQLWRCHSCDKAGSSYDLIMAKEKTDFRGARAFASAQQFAARSGGGSDSELSGSAYGGRRKVSDRSRNQPRGGGYTPTWRRD
ncbi:CHC2 zinc finger domain-containing protein [Actinoplanes sp. NPDC049548]|uniref:CHC2 zinc finger domain-containing protein n=1 Tax=Actinoplanes sp. NPDC049548 TaxID=3155152 RepID=UPI00342DBDB6